MGWAARACSMTLCRSHVDLSTRGFLRKVISGERHTSGSGGRCHRSSEGTSTFYSSHSKKKKDQTKCWCSKVARKRLRSARHSLTRVVDDGAIAFQANTNHASCVGTLQWSHAWLLTVNMHLFNSPCIFRHRIRDSVWISPCRQVWRAGSRPCVLASQKVIEKTPSHSSFF